MQRVTAPLLQAYEKLPSGPQISTVSPGHTTVSGAEIEHVTLPQSSAAESLSATRTASPLLTHGDWKLPSTLAPLTTSPEHSAVRPTRMTMVQLAPSARLNGP